MELYSNRDWFAVLLIKKTRKLPAFKRSSVIWGNGHLEEFWIYCIDKKFGEIIVWEVNRRPIYTEKEENGHLEEQTTDSR